MRPFVGCKDRRPGAREEVSSRPLTIGAKIAKMEAIPKSFAPLRLCVRWVCALACERLD